MPEIIGTNDNDTLSGTNATDTIFGLDGNDIIDASDDDHVFAGGGDDYLLFGRIGKLGVFQADGGSGYDVLTIYLQPSHENPSFSFAELLVRGASLENIENINIRGTNLNDGEIIGSSFDEHIFGGGGTDFLFGGDGNDVLWDSGGLNTLSGEAGDDTLIFDLSSSTLQFLANGGTGYDQVILQLNDSNGNDFSLVTSLATGSHAVSIEHYQINGSSGMDRIVGSELFDTISGGAGNDQLYGENGDDNIQGQGGADQLFGGAGNDQLFILVEKSSDLSFRADGGTGNDELFIDLRFGDVSNYSLDTAIQNGAIIGLEKITLFGSNSDDTLYGTTAEIFNHVNGWMGNDVIMGGDGTQSLSGDDGDDLIEAGAGSDSLSGGFGNDILYGGDGDDTLFGGAYPGDVGDDVLNGDAGNDYLDGGAGNDVLRGGAGDDIILGGSGNDIIYADVHDAIDGGDGVDTLVLSGFRANYTPILLHGQIYLADTPNGAKLSGIEQIQFADRLTSTTQLTSEAKAFDPLAYIASHPDLLKGYGANAAAGMQHFLEHGFLEGRGVNFDPLAYIASYPDLLQGLGADATAGARHYIEHGYYERRGVDFDPLAYIATYPDLLQGFGTNADAGTRHYIEHGFAEGRSVLFDALAYVASHPDLLQGYGANTQAGLLHYIEHGFGEGRGVSFDALAYGAGYIDLAQGLGDNVEALTRHYIEHGFAEGRVPDPGFDEVGYLLSNADLASAGIGSDAALEHWLLHGVNEGRLGDALYGREQIDHALSATLPAQGSLINAEDHDWFIFSGQMGQTIEIEYSSSAIDGTIGLYRSNGQLLAESSTGPGSASLTYHLAENDDYYTVVHPDYDVIQPEQIGVLGSYQLDLHYI